MGEGWDIDFYDIELPTAAPKYWKWSTLKYYPTLELIFTLH